MLKEQKSIIIHIKKEKLVRFNISKETTIENLIGRLGSAWISFKFIPGPFTETLEKGYLLLLDEVIISLLCMENILRYWRNSTRYTKDVEK